jgi:hypothetical protein
MPDKTYPISPLDARFHDVTQDEEVTSRSAWDSVVPQLNAMTTTPDALPKVDLEYAASQLIGMWLTLASLRAPTLALLSDAQALKTALALDGLPRRAHALLYVLRQNNNIHTEKVSLSDLNREGLALCELGLRWCMTLESLGHVAEGTTQAIKKGRKSHRKTINSLSDLYDALHPHLSLIAPLQATASKPISGADIDRMGRLAALMRQALNRNAPTLSWRVALLRIADLIAHDYKTATAAIRFYLDLSDDPNAPTIPMFGTFRRPKRKSNSKQSPTPQANHTENPPQHPLDNPQP